ncbi:hypothetical protein FEM48_Zijuj09G0053600 [Ziziphus jujuba var. spinosa]|uniref:Uncharacterized protein n=1 Tax=Ziziphus jujuba var. spinosa TaxID=714518 RepID=A0A978UR45_ZIZJJ|nr:hypothetical protein FEM48_Zijuj09G0053600 [Ziziphus jujuba var. spinosa]
MAMMKFLSMFLVATAMVFLMSMHQHEAGRVFNGDRNLLLGSLAGSSKNPSPNPGTLIPKNFAGHIRPPPPPPRPSSDAMQILFGMATGPMVFLMNMHQHEAGRVLNGDRKLMENEYLLLGSLSGPSTNPAPNPPTHIPKKAKVSTINQKNFAGHTQPPPRHPPSGPLMENEYLLLGSLSGPSTNPAPNPSTHIPVPKKAKVSTINQKNFAGHTQPPPRHPPSGPLMENENLLLGSLARNRPTTPSPNPPTLIPSPGKAKASTINPKNFAGHNQLPPPSPPRPFSTTKQLLFVMAIGRK